MMTTLSRRLGRLEALTVPTTPSVWFEDLDTGELVCQATGERISVEEARHLGASDIAVRYIRDWRGHGPEA